MPAFKFFKDAFKSLSKSSHVKKTDNSIFCHAWQDDKAILEFKMENPGKPFKLTQGPALRPGGVFFLIEEDKMPQIKDANVPKSKM